MVYAFIQDVPISEDLYRRIIENLGTIAHSGGMWQAYPGDPNDELTALRPCATALLRPDEVA